MPTNGTTPTLVGNTTLTLNGQIVFVVDPASMNVTSVQSPEPASLGAASLIAPAALRRRRR